VIMRVLTRLNLVEDELCFEAARNICNKIVEETGYSHRYVDIVIVKFGHRKDDMDTGIVNGICLEDIPKCIKCLLTEHCHFEEKQISTDKQKNNINKIKSANQNIEVTPSIKMEDELNEEIEKITSINRINNHVKMLLVYLFQGIKSYNINYGIKFRRDAVALTLKWNERKNITTIWLQNDGFRILVLGQPGEIGVQNRKGKKCSKTSDIDADVLQAIQNKYNELTN
ncbi:MAG: hypothetical protein PHX14_12670, partial [Syntrophomonadaceae bacterium]|nr:hypothetical protein [Syntrophomonadaceae bacterium]